MAGKNKKKNKQPPLIVEQPKQASKDVEEYRQELFSELGFSSEDSTKLAGAKKSDGTYWRADVLSKNLEAGWTHRQVVDLVVD